MHFDAEEIQQMGKVPLVAIAATNGEMEKYGKQQIVPTVTGGTKIVGVTSATANRHIVTALGVGIERCFFQSA
jgi:hypothetical protein